MSSHKFNIENAKKAAVGFANDSLNKGCLFKHMPDEDTHDDSKGDAETLNTLASLVVNEGVDDIDIREAEDIVLAHLELKFPAFC